MCTCIRFKTKDTYFGRTLDLDYRFNENVVITPRNYNFKLKNGLDYKNKYAIVGMATVMDNYPLYAEASNECGLAMAGLNFPNNCHLNDNINNKLNLAMFELIPYFLGKYKTIDELLNELNNLNITNIPYKEGMPLGQMHFMISDLNKSIVVEQTINGLKIYDNPLDVMTNNPTFDYHLLNINNYLNLNPKVVLNDFQSKLNLKTYGEGMGAIGLPGDTSPSSRLVRATFNLKNSVCNDDLESSISQFFHILDSVSMVRGSTITKNNTYDITSYSSCINLNKGIYFYKTYENNQINAIKLNNNINDNKLVIFKLNEKQNINYQN